MPNLLDTLRCPITGDLMMDPAILVCSGVSYERSALEVSVCFSRCALLHSLPHLQDWVANRGTNPETGEPLQDARIVGNPCLRALIGAVVADM